MIPSLSSWLYLLVCGLAIVDALLTVPFAREAAIVALVVFMAVEFTAAARAQQVVGVALSAIGLGVAAAVGDFEAVLVRGLGNTLPFIVLFGAVTWLQAPAAESPTLKAARDTVLSQPPGWRYLMLALTAHGLGAAFNLAGMSLLSTMVSQQKDATLRQRLARAMTHGFGVASSWSPLFVGAAVILSVLPSVRWLEIAPAGLVMGACLVGLSWGLDRLAFPAGAAARAMHAPVRFPAWAARRLAVVLAALFVLVIGVVEAFRLPIPIALGLIAPPFALLWQLSRVAPLAGVGRRTGDLARRVVYTFAGLRSEAILFASANLFGAGINAAVSPKDAARVLAALGLPVDVLLFGIAFAVVIGGALGLHAVILVVLIGHILPPEVLALPAPVLAIVLMCTWGLSTNISPFSATTLFMARVTGESIWTLAWRWNGLFSLTAALAVGALVVLIRHLGLY
jgi:hypothetical protein